MSTSNNQLAKIRRTARHYIIRELPVELENIMKEMGLHDFSIEPETERVDVNGNRTELRATTHYVSLPALKTLTGASKRSAIANL